MHIGDRIREARKKKNITAKNLSELSGIPEKTIYRIETGEVKDPKISSIIPLIKCLDCTSDEILFDKNDFFQLGDLKQAFLLVSQLPEEDIELIITMIRKISLATNITNHISAEMENANYIYKPKLNIVDNKKNK